MKYDEGAQNKKRDRVDCMHACYAVSSSAIIQLLYCMYVGYYAYIHTCTTSYHVTRLYLFIVISFPLVDYENQAKDKKSSFDRSIPCFFLILREKEESREKEVTELICIYMLFMTLCCAKKEVTYSAVSFAINIHSFTFYHSLTLISLSLHLETRTSFTQDNCRAGGHIINIIINRARV